MSKKNTSNRLSDLSVTIYPGYALIQGSYPVRLAQGANRFQVEGLPTHYDPNSLYFDSFLGEGEITLGAANYRAANLSPAVMLQRAVNKRVTVIYGGQTEAEQKEITGTLVASNGNTALLKLAKNKIREIRNVVGYIFGGVPEGVSNTPSLSVNVEASAAGDYEAKLLYKALGLNWAADYKWIYDEARGLVTIDGSVSINNGSGASFPDASLKVVAGDAGAESDGVGLEAMAMPMAAMAGGAPKRASRNVRQAEAESVGQVKVFTIPGKNSVEEGESQKMPFLVVPEVPVGREYRVVSQYGWHGARGSRSEATVRTVLLLTNTEANKLGKPLPGGMVAVMQRDSSGALLKSGGGRLEDTAVGEEAKLGIGSDFDLKATRIVLDLDRKEEVEDLPEAQQAQEQDDDAGEPEVLHEGPRMSMAVTSAQPERKAKKKNQRLKVTITKKCAVELFNAKGFDVEFVVEENTYGDQLQFGGDHGFTQTDANSHEKRVKLAAGAKATVEYTLVQTSYENLR